MKIWILFVSLFLVLISYVSVAQENVSATQDSNKIFLEFNQKQPFVFMGKIDVNKASGNAGAIMYPGDNALVFFTAILTHAAIEGGVEGSRNRKIQDDANKVLDDYQAYISQFNTAENAAISQVDINIEGEISARYLLTDPELKNSAHWTMTTSPVFFMTQNYGSLILYNKMVMLETTPETIKKQKRSKTTAPSARVKKTTDKNEKIVVIISDPIAEPEYKKFWLNNNGKAFLETLKKMYKESLTLIVANKLANESKQSVEQVTIKYIEYGEKKVERGFIIFTDCKRTLFEGLSGEIKSVPNLDFLKCGLPI